MDVKDQLTVRIAPNATNQHTEAYYMFIISPVGFLLNIIVIVFVLKRRSLRRMTSSFIIHCCLLDMVKTSISIYFGHHLLSQAKPSGCTVIGQIYVIAVTTSAFNLVAMVCSEAYTFEEMNVGGNYRGSLYCVIFGVLLVYFGSVLLHLGPTIISGYFDFHPEIGYCSFRLGIVKSYVANVIWIVIMTMAFVAVIYYIVELHRQIQGNQPSRVSMLVRTSVCLGESPLTERNIKLLIDDCNHRVKLLLGVTIVFISFWYPYFVLLIIDMNYRVSSKVYQTLCFIAWSHSSIEPAIFVLFDRHLRLLAKVIYCNDSYFQRLDTFASLLKYREEKERNLSNARESIDAENTADTNRAPFYRPNVVPKEILMAQYYTEV